MPQPPGVISMSELPEHLRPYQLCWALLTPSRPILQTPAVVPWSSKGCFSDTLLNRLPFILSCNGTKLLSSPRHCAPRQECPSCVTHRPLELTPQCPAWKLLPCPSRQSEP